MAVGRPKRVSDHDVLAQARRLFLTEGHAASTRAIAQHAGLSQAALVQRFGSKDKLFIAAVRPDALDIETILGTEDDAQRLGGVEYLAQVADRLLDVLGSQIPRLLHLHQHPAITAAALTAAHEHLGVEALVAAFRRRVGWMQRHQVLARHVASETVVDGVLTLVHGVAFMRLASGAPVAKQQTRLRRLVRAFFSPVVAEGVR